MPYAWLEKSISAVSDPAPDWVGDHLSRSQSSRLPGSNWHMACLWVETPSVMHPSRAFSARGVLNFAKVACIREFSGEGSLREDVEMVMGTLKRLTAWFSDVLMISFIHNSSNLPKRLGSSWMQLSPAVNLMVGTSSSTRVLSGPTPMATSSFSAAPPLLSLLTETRILL